MNAVDTNILIYARDPRDVQKQAIADGLLSSMIDGVLLWQVACEYLAATRKLEQFGYERAQAIADLADMRQAWQTILPSWNVLDRALYLLTKYRLSFWDATLIAACLEAGVTRLYSEDFDTSAQAEGLEIVNPFAEPQRAA
jgi:predicted nucleic acid-binding protein